ncbi:MAG: hypothetical protein R3B95_20555 [Nitrospirales bacterium]|nr:hypothetical protein [Nitrospirales bacterium]
MSAIQLLGLNRLIFLLMVVCMGCAPGHRNPFFLDIRKIDADLRPAITKKVSDNYDCTSTGYKCKLIVFVHGVLGDVDTTWGKLEEDVKQTNDNSQGKTKTAKSWLFQMKNDNAFDDYDIYAFNYETSLVYYSSNITEIANQLYQSLKDHEVFRKYSEVHFVTHSMGGLVAKRMLINLHQEGHDDDLDHIRTVFFLGNPAHGSFWANIVSWFTPNRQFNDMESEDLNTYLQTLAQDWGVFRTARHRIRPEWPFPLIYCAHETKPSYLITIVNRIQVEDCEGSSLPISANHVQMVKPRNSTEEPYPWVKRLILDASKVEGLANNRVVLMDSGWTRNIYDDYSKDTGRTNADEINDILKLKRIPVTAIKELTNLTWDRYAEIRKINPALIVIHYSAFDTQTNCGDTSGRFRSFMNEFLDTKIKFLVYTRGEKDDQNSHHYCLNGLRDVKEQLHNTFGNRIQFFTLPPNNHPKINSGQKTFRAPNTANLLASCIRKMLGLKPDGPCVEQKSRASVSD